MFALIILHGMQNSWFHLFKTCFIPNLSIYWLILAKITIEIIDILTYCWSVLDYNSIRNLLNVTYDA